MWGKERPAAAAAGQSLFNLSDRRRWNTTRLSRCPKETQKTETAEEALNPEQTPKQSLSAKEKTSTNPDKTLMKITSKKAKDTLFCFKDF